MNYNTTSTQFCVIPQEWMQDMTNMMQSLTQQVQTISATSNCMPEYMTQQQVCDYLSISDKTLYRLRQRGGINFSTIGDKIYYTREDIRHLMDSNRVTAKYY